MDKAIYSEEQVILSSLLREFRTKNHLRQSDVADRLGVPQSFVSKYESGERRLDLIEIRQVATALGVTADQILEELERRVADLAVRGEAIAALQSDEPAGPGDDAR